MTSSHSNFKDAGIAIVLLLIIQVLLGLQFGVFKGILIDTDAFMWLNRALQFHENGMWFDHQFLRINPPVGYEQHWTRPFDLVLLSGAWLGAIITDFRSSLYIWSTLVSPVLEILALFSFLWLISPVLGNKESGVAGLLFVTQIAIISSFNVGRADHQSLILLFFILSLGFGLRMLLGPFDRQTCYLAALVAALSIWVSVESILFPLLMIFVFGIYWLRGEAGITLKLVHYLIALFLLLVIFRTLEFGPSRLLEPVLDQISIVYITLFGVIALYWTIVSGFERLYGNKIKLPIKLFSAIFWTVSMAVLLDYYFPGFFSGPWGNIDELFKRVHLAKIKELQPVISLTALSNGNWLDALLRFSIWLGIIVPGIPILIFLILKTNSTVRLCWIFIGIFSLVYIPLSLNEVRWVPYVAVLMLPGYIWFIVTLMQSIADRFKGHGAGLMRVVLLVGSAIVFALPTVLFSEEEEELDETGSCPLIPISEYLSDPLTWGDRPRNILAFTDFGPELLYRTPHLVFSIPSHRYHSGFTDSYIIMTTTDAEQAMQLAKKRQVDLILICPDGHENHFYELTNDTESLHQRLSSNAAPDWLEQIKLPDDLADSFMLYRVIESVGPIRQLIELVVPEAV